MSLLNGQTRDAADRLRSCLRREVLVRHRVHRVVTSLLAHSVEDTRGLLEQGHSTVLFGRTGNGLPAKRDRSKRNRHARN